MRNELARIHGDMLELRNNVSRIHDKYEDVLAVVNQVNQYSLFMASHAMRANDGYAILKSRIETLEVGTYATSRCRN